MSNDSTSHVAHAEPNYLAIWGLLAVLTVLEIGITFLHVPRIVIVVGLVGMALVKAILVAVYFMHLKFEKRTLALIAVTPLVLCTFLLIMLMPDAYPNPINPAHPPAAAAHSGG